jgi:ribosomal protein L22
MAEEIKNQKQVNAEKPVVVKDKKVDTIVDNKTTPVDTKPVSTETKKEEKKEIKVKKTEAFAKASAIHASKKHCMAIGNMIKNKSIDQAIADLEQVLLYKKIVPFRGEIPHRKGPGIMSGRYPINASKMFITILKGLKGNAIVNGLDLQKTRIFLVQSDWAARYSKKSGGRFKRANIIIKAKEIK